MIMAQPKTHYVVEAELTSSDCKTFRLTYHDVVMWVQDPETCDVHPVVHTVKGLMTFRDFDRGGALWLGRYDEKDEDQPYIDAEARDYAARTMREWVQQ